MDPGSLVAVPLPNGSYCVLWILEAGEFDGRGYYQFLIMDGFLAAIPKPAEQANLRLAPAPGRPLPGREDVWKGSFFGDLPSDFTIIGNRALPDPTHPYFDDGRTMVFQSGEDTRQQLHLSWRLIHDRPALEAEWAQATARHEAAAEQRRTRTLPQMARERVFPSWSERWPPRVVREARRIFRDATRALIALQANGTKRQRTATLKRIVSEFNALYDREGCVETVEREQIVARVEALAALVGVSNEDEKLTGHRDW